MTDADAFAHVSERTGSYSQGRTLFVPSTHGPAQFLARVLARGHGVIAVMIAVIASYATFTFLFTALGLLVTHVFVHGPIGAWDHHVSLWFDVHRSPRGNSITGYVTDVADTFQVATVATIVTIFLFLRKWRHESLLLVFGLVTELSVFLTVNKLVGRHRPSVSHLGGTPSTYSFPSGHTAAAMVLYGGVAVVVVVATDRWWPRCAMWTLAIVVTIAVGLSRVYRGEHYPSDALAGFLLGIGSLGAAIFIIRVAGVTHAPVLRRGQSREMHTRITST